MKLNKKEIKHYKPLIIKKLTEMGVKNQLGYTKTGSNRRVASLVESEEGGPKYEIKEVPAYQASNLMKNLTKKILNMNVAGVERFLATIVEPKTEVVVPEGDVTNG